MKILYTASVLSHICQFHLPMMEMLQQQGWEVHVAARNNLDEKNGLQLRFCDKYIEIPFQRSPKDRRNLEAFRQLKSLLSEEHFDIILCNTPVCSILTRIAAKESRRNGTKVIYMAHGFHFFKGAPLKNWMFYPVEKFFANHCTDLLITVNNQDYERAKKHFRCRVEHIHGVGVDSNRYHPATPEEQHEMRLREGLSDDDFVILCTGELLPNKNQKTLIEAVSIFKEILRQEPHTSSITSDQVKLLIAGNGSERENLEALSEKLHLEDTVRFLGYRTDLEKLVPCVDVVASASFREGLGLNIVEAMLCAKPVVASHNRGHDELIENGVTGFLVNPESAEQFADKFITFLHCTSRLISELGISGFDSVRNYTSEAIKKEFFEIIAELGNAGQKDFCNYGHI